MRTLWAVLLAGLVAYPGLAQLTPPSVSIWGAVQTLEFGQDELPANLYSMFTGDPENSVLQYCLPADYSQEKTYPLIVYVPGFHGHPGGNIGNAKDIANSHECVVASLPLFKATLDRSEIGKGLILSFSDYAVLGSAYEMMFEKFFTAVPNIDPTKSGMVGFSNGALAIAVLISSNNQYILERFQSFCLVDHGMFHLTDLHKHPARDRRFLIMVGDRDGLGRELKIRGAKLWEDSFQLLEVDVESRVLLNTGHELTDACKVEIGNWILN